MKVPSSLAGEGNAAIEPARRDEGARAEPSSILVAAMPSRLLPQGEGTPPAPAISQLQASLHRRNNKFGAFLDAGGPARRHRLGLGVEAPRVRAVLVEVAEARALPAAEGVVGERHRNGEIHADHADFDPVDEVARRVAVAGEDGDAVAVFVLG